MLPPLEGNAIMREAGVAKVAVWRWQERFMQEGVDGFLGDKTRPSRIKPLGPDVAERVVRLTPTDPPGEATHWTADPDKIIAAVRRGHQAPDSIH